MTIFIEVTKKLTGRKCLVNLDQLISVDIEESPQGTVCTLFFGVMGNGQALVLIAEESYEQIRKLIDPIEIAPNT